MSGYDGDFEGRLASWLRSDAPDEDPPGLLEAVVARTATTHRRPRWAIRSWWLATTGVRVPVWTYNARAAWFLAVLAVLAATAAALISAGAFRRLPPPVGPAAAGALAFDSDGDIVVIDSVGGNRHWLLTTPQLETSPVFSPDGTRIAYWSRDAAGLPASLWVMDADGSDRRNLTGTANVSSSESLQAAWSPDSRRLAFSVGDYYSSTQLWVVGSDGADLHSLGGGTLARSDPAWSPDSRIIAFRGHTTGVLPDAVPADPAIGVYVIAADGTEERRVSVAPRAGGAPNNASFGGPHVGTAPSWSPDGTSLLYASGSTGHHGLAIGAANGSSEHLIDLPAGDHLLPVFSPDGLRVAFEDYSATGEDARAFVAAIDGSGVRPLHGGDPVAFNPLFWSPDGRFVATYSVDLSTIDLSPVDTAEAGNTAAPMSIPLGRATAEGFPERTTWQRLAP